MDVGKGREQDAEALAGLLVTIVSGEHRLFTADKSAEYPSRHLDCHQKNQVQHNC